jgi:hypothetical protein
MLASREGRKLCFKGYVSDPGHALQGIVISVVRRSSASTLVFADLLATVTFAGSTLPRLRRVSCCRAAWSLGWVKFGGSEGEPKLPT